MVSEVIKPPRGTRIKNSQCPAKNLVVINIWSVIFDTFKPRVDDKKSIQNFQNEKIKYSKMIY